jgi:hypothetical protein
MRLPPAPLKMKLGGKIKVKAGFGTLKPSAHHPQKPHLHNAESSDALTMRSIEAGLGKKV